MASGLKAVPKIEIESSEIKVITVRTNTEGWKALKLLALEHEATLNALAIEALNDLLKKYGKRATVENPHR
jgi:predicted HicB family RNase H-like nuclease